MAQLARGLFFPAVSAAWGSAFARNVRFGSLADILTSPRHVRFTPDCRRNFDLRDSISRAILIQEAGFLDSIVAYSTQATDFCNTIPPIADIRRMSWHVRFVPEADIGDCPGRRPQVPPKGAQAQTTQLLNLIASLVDGIAASRAFAGRSREKPEADFDLMLFNRRQLIELAILGAKVGDVGFDAHLPTSRPLDKFVRLKLASMLIEMFAQPSMQRTEFADCDLTRDIRDVL